MPGSSRQGRGRSWRLPLEPCPDGVAEGAERDLVITVLHVLVLSPPPVASPLLGKTPSRSKRLQGFRGRSGHRPAAWAISARTIPWIRCAHLGNGTGRRGQEVDARGLGRASPHWCPVPKQPHSCICRSSSGRRSNSTSRLFFHGRRRNLIRPRLRQLLPHSASARMAMQQELRSST